MGPKVRGRLEPEDVLQETFAVAFQSIGQVQWYGEERFYRWLGSIAEHVIWSSSQKKAWEQIRLRQDVRGVDHSPSKEMRRNERFERLERALEGLSNDHRDVITLARLEGLTVSEIATRMDRSPNAVKKLLARALTRLKESFGDTESLHLPARRMGLKDDA
jgi:RNA polymerase sigma-70 factor (ECF subfamily)